MKNYIYIFLVIAIACTNARAGETFIDRYLLPRLKKAATNDDLNGDYFWEIMGHGGYILKREIDVTNDGIPEVFLSVSLESQDRVQAPWTIFKLGNNGDYQEYAEIIPELFGVFLLPQSGKIILLNEYAPDYQTDEGLKNRLLPREVVKHRLDFLTFDFPHINLKKLNVTDEEAKNVKRTSNKIDSHCDAILLFDYLTDKEVKWTKSDFSLNSYGYFVLEKDVDKINLNASFKATKALQLLESRILKYEREKQRELRDEANHSARNSNNSEATKIFEKPTSRQWYIIAGILLLTLTGIYWMKRKS